MPKIIRNKTLQLICILCLIAADQTAELFVETPCAQPSHIDANVTRLKKQLRMCYDRRQQPPNPGIAVEAVLLVSFEYDEWYTEFLTLRTLLVMRWMDVRLKWNATDYGGLNSVNMWSRSIWRPRFLYNNRERARLQAVRAAPHVRVSDAGYLTAVYPHYLRMCCHADVTKWPFDSQTCAFNYVSLFDVDMRNETGFFDDTHYTPSFAWRIDNFTFVRKELSQVAVDREVGVFKYHFRFTVERMSAGAKWEIFTNCFVIVTMTLFSLSLDMFSFERKLFTFFSIAAHMTITWNMRFYEDGFVFYLWYTSGLNRTPDIIKFYTLSIWLAAYTLFMLVIFKAIVTIHRFRFDRVIATMNILRSTRIVHFMLLSGSRLEQLTTANKFNGNASTNTSAVISKVKYTEWYLVGRVFERLSAIVIILTYAYGVYLYVPVQTLFN